jgi:hypothetical protein
MQRLAFALPPSAVLARPPSVTAIQMSLSGAVAGILSTLAVAAEAERKETSTLALGPFAARATSSRARAPSHPETCACPPITNCGVERFSRLNRRL